MNNTNIRTVDIDTDKNGGFNIWVFFVDRHTVRLAHTDNPSVINRINYLCLLWKKEVFVSSDSTVSITYRRT